MAIAVDGGQAKDVVERFVTLCRENDRRSKSTNKGWKVDQEVKLRLVNWNAGSTLCGDVQKVLYRACQLGLRILNILCSIENNDGVPNSSLCC